MAWIKKTNLDIIYVKPGLSESVSTTVVYTSKHKLKHNRTVVRMRTTQSLAQPHSIKDVHYTSLNTTTQY